MLVVLLSAGFPIVRPFFFNRAYTMKPGYHWHCPYAIESECYPCIKVDLSVRIVSYCQPNDIINWEKSLEPTNILYMFTCIHMPPSTQPVAPPLYPFTPIFPFQYKNNNSVSVCVRVCWWTFMCVLYMCISLIGKKK